MLDADGEPYLIITKNGCSTGVTIGRVTGVNSFVCEYFAQVTPAPSSLTTSNVSGVSSSAVPARGSPPTSHTCHLSTGEAVRIDDVSLLFLAFASATSSPPTMGWLLVQTGALTGGLLFRFLFFLFCLTFLYN